MTESPPLDIAALVRTHQVEIWRYLRLLGSDPAEAEDLCQETFLAVLRKPFPESEPRSTAAYLRQVARNLLLKRRRSARREPRVEDLEQIDTVWSEVASEDGGQDYIDALRECLASVSGRARQCLELCYGSGRSRGEIAAELGVGEDAVKSMLRRTRASLRSCIARRMV